MKLDQLYAFLKAHLSLLSFEGGCRLDLDFPDFELTAFDFLDFAEKSLAGDGEADRINCIAHLKRAAECQLDTFLHVMKARTTGKRPSFLKKLESIRPFGVLSPRSLAKLNRMRNKLEHEYASPDIADLELYFELVSAFVHAVEGYILMLTTYGGMQFGCERNGAGLHLVVEFGLQKPSLRFDCRRNKDDAFTLEFTDADGESWGHAVRVFFLLCRFTSLVGAEFVVSRLAPVSPVPKISSEPAGDA